MKISKIQSLESNLEGVSLLDVFKMLIYVAYFHKPKVISNLSIYKKSLLSKNMPEFCQLIPNSAAKKE